VEVRVLGLWGICTAEIHDVYLHESVIAELGVGMSVRVDDVSRASRSTSASSSSSASRAPSTPASDSSEGDLCEFGLHVVRRGIVLGGQFQVQRRLSGSKASTVWECITNLSDGDRDPRLAVKVYQGSERYRELAQREMRLWERVARARAASSDGDPCLVRFQGGFVHVGGYCQHQCLMFELLGPTALQIAQRCRGDKFPASLLCALARDALTALLFLHQRCGIIHTDVKPENFLTRFERRPPLKRLRTDASQSSRLEAVGALCDSEVTFCLADLGNGRFLEEPRSGTIQTCEYRSPEVLLGEDFDKASDIWSLACTVFECATGRYLFDPRLVQTMEPFERCGEGGCASDSEIEEEHLAQIQELCGPFPEALVSKASARRQATFINEPGRGWVLKSSRDRPVRVGRTLRERLAGADVSGFTPFLMPMLAVEPSCRAAAQSLLESLPS